MSIRDKAILVWQEKKERIKKDLLDDLRSIFGDDVSIQVLDNNSPLLDMPDDESIYVYIQDGDTPMVIEAFYNPFTKKFDYSIVTRCSSCKDVYACDDYTGVISFTDLETLGRALELSLEARPICSRCYQ